MTETISSKSTSLEVEVLIGTGDKPDRMWAAIPFAGKLLVDGSVHTELGNKIRIGDHEENGIPEDIRAEIGQYSDGMWDS
jgi:hypothetical protein